VPQNVGKPLTNQGVFNSGMMVPNTPAPQSFTLKIGITAGEIPYVCLLHDAMGMKGSLVVSQ
jgi:plastocyanin